MSWRHHATIRNQNALETAIAMRTHDVVSRMEVEPPESSCVEVNFPHVYGVPTGAFVTGLAKQVLGDLEARGILGWNFDIEASKQKGQTLDSGYLNPEKLWDHPVIIFVRGQAMAEVIAIGTETASANGLAA